MVEEALREVYDRLAKNPDDPLSNLKIYHSSIYYTRSAIFANTGIWLTLKDTQRYIDEENLSKSVEDLIAQEETELEEIESEVQV